MRKPGPKKLFSRLLCLGLSVIIAAPSIACTTFRLQSQDGAWITGRSMELALPLDSRLMLVKARIDLAVCNYRFLAAIGKKFY